MQRAVQTGIITNSLSYKYSFSLLTVKCQNPYVSNNSDEHKYGFNVKTALFQAIQFNIST